MTVHITDDMMAKIKAALQENAEAMNRYDTGRAESPDDIIEWANNARESWERLGKLMRVCALTWNEVQEIEETSDDSFEEAFLNRMGG